MVEQGGLPLFENVQIYMKKTRSERIAHMDLKTPCIEIGGDSQNFRGLLAHSLKTTIPRGMKILLCHGCNNPKCSNTAHLYWGTTSENLVDWLSTIKSHPLKGRRFSELHKKNLKAAKAKVRHAKCSIILSGKGPDL
jgi:hypothetical protein